MAYSTQLISIDAWVLVLDAQVKQSRIVDLLTSFKDFPKSIQTTLMFKVIKKFLIFLWIILQVTYFLQKSWFIWSPIEFEGLTFICFIMNQILNWAMCWSFFWVSSSYIQTSKLLFIFYVQISNICSGASGHKHGILVTPLASMQLSLSCL